MFRGGVYFEVNDLSLNYYEDIYYHLRRLKKDETYIKYINNIIDMNFMKDPEETWFVVNQVIQISEASNYKLALSWGYAFEGAIYFYRGNALQAYENFSKAYDIFRIYEEKEGLIYCCNGFMGIYSYYGQFKDAIDWGIKGLELAIEGDLNDKIASININMVSLYIKYEMFDEAQSIIDRLEASQSGLNCECKLLRDVDKAVIQIKKENYDEAFRVISRAQEKVRMNNINGLKDIVYMVAAIVHSKRYENEFAQECFKKALQFSEEFKSNKKDEILKCWGSYYLDLEDIINAEKLLLQAEVEGRKLDKRFELIDIFQKLSKLYSLKFDYRKAYEYSKARNQIIGDILNAQTRIAFSKVNEKNNKLNMELYQEMYTTINIMSDIGKRITSSLELENVVDIIYSEIGKIMEVELMGIGFLYNGECIEYEFLIDKGQKTKPVKIHMGQNISFSEYCIKNNADILVKDSSTEYRKYMVLDNKFKYMNSGRPLSHIYCPMVIGEKIIGIITVQHYDNNIYSYRDLTKIKLLSNYVAVALENSKLYKEAKYFSKYDQLTGVYNRREIYSIGSEISQKYKHTNFPISILMIDIDKFKHINDSYGHYIGDKVLEHTGNILKNEVENIGYAGRYGGEEFMAILPEINKDKAFELAEKIRIFLEKNQFEAEVTKFNATASIGVHTVSGDMFDFEKCLNIADKALYRAKLEGRNQVVVL